MGCYNMYLKIFKYFKRFLNLQHRVGVVVSCILFCQIFNMRYFVSPNLYSALLGANLAQLPLSIELYTTGVWSGITEVEFSS